MVSCWTHEGGGLRGSWTVGGVTVPPKRVTFAPEVGPTARGGDTSMLIFEGRGELETAIRLYERVGGVANSELSLGDDMEKFEAEEEEEEE